MMGQIRTDGSNKKPDSIKVMAARRLARKRADRKRAEILRAREGSIKFSPSWVVANAKDSPGFKMELIDRIRVGVKKSEWKQLIHSINSTEKEF